MRIWVGYCDCRIRFISSGCGFIEVKGIDKRFEKGNKLIAFVQETD